MVDTQVERETTRCPVCSYQSPFDVVRCPHCESSFDAADLNELGHLAYVRKWLVERSSQGLLPEAQSAELLEDVNRREVAVQMALGLSAPATVPVSNPAALAPADQVPVDAGRILDLVDSALARGDTRQAERLLDSAATQTAMLGSHQPTAAATVPTTGVERAQKGQKQPTDPSSTAVARPTFSWAQVGIYLLSERTLHGLLGLGAFLILASGVVISTLNPTALGPALHLLAVLCTTALFYVAGYVVRRRLQLALTGAALLSIGGAFIPLCVWTLGLELVHWEPGVIWLAASLLCLPVYVASHFVLRDWTFAVLTAVTGGSALLSLSNWLGVPLEWELVLLIALGYVYLWLSVRLSEGWRLLAQGLAWTAQVAIPLTMAALLAAKFSPAAWGIAARKPLGEWSDYAIGCAWWLGAGFFAFGAAALRRSYLRALATWSVPVAYLLTLTKAPWDASWYDVALALLAGVYVLYGRWGLTDLPATLRLVVREQVYQAAFALSVVALAWPPATIASQCVTLLLLALVYGVAAAFLRLRLLAYGSIYLLPIAWARLLDLAQLDMAVRPLAWTALTAALLFAAELEVRRTGEYQRSLVATALGFGTWRSVFAPPVFSAGYAVGLLGLGVACARYWNAPADPGVRLLDTPTILAFLALVAVTTLSTISRRASGFLYVAAWLFLIPFTATAGRLFAIAGAPLMEADLARLLALLGTGYLLLAFAVDRVGVRYSQALHLVGYALSLATMPLSVLDRAINVQVIGLSLVVYAISAYLVFRGRHRAFLDVVGRLLESTSGEFRHIAALFMYFACWLFPGWLLLMMSLSSPPPALAACGVVLTLLAPVYVTIGWLARVLRPEYRWPWYLGGYALSAIGPLVTTPDPPLRVAALAASILLYVASALVSRRSAWVYVATLLTPVLVWQALDLINASVGADGLALILLSSALAFLGVVIFHGTRGLRRLLRPIGAPVSEFARPLFIVSYAVCALGLALVTAEDAQLVALAFLLAAVLFGGSAFVFRQPLFGYPLAGTTAVAYVMGMKLLVSNELYYGLALLPGVCSYLGVGELLRRRLDTAVLRFPPTWSSELRHWAAPFYAAAYLGTIAVPVWSRTEQGIWATAWSAVCAICALSAVLFRRPVWLYPTLLAGIVAYLATAYAVSPRLTVAGALALLVIPGWLFFGSASATSARMTPGSSPSLEVVWRRGLSFAPAWPDPMAACGWLALSLAVVGSVVDATTGLWAAASCALLFAVVGTVWRGRAEVWATLLVATVALEHVLRLLSLPLIDQPPRLALVALVVSVVAVALRRQSRPVLAIWRRPLYFWAIGLAIVAGVDALLSTLVLEATFGHWAGLQSLSATVALSGLSLIAHGFDRKEWILGYCGVALLDVGYMLQLVFFDVGQPQAFAIPAGLYMMTVVFLEWRRGTGARFKCVVEIGGLTLLLGVSLLQAVGFAGAGVDRFVYDTLLLVEGVAVFGLGAMLHWRRSFFCGGIAVILAVLILLADPLRALNTWYLVAIIGLAMISAVVFIEQRRQRIPFWLNTWRQRLEAWD